MKKQIGDYIVILEPYKTDKQQIGLFSKNMGWGNGYVGVPPHHPFYGLDEYHRLIQLVNIHGGITFNGSKGDDYWYFGFDTAHFKSGELFITEKDVYDETIYLLYQIDLFSKSSAQNHPNDDFIQEFMSTHGMFQNEYYNEKLKDVLGVNYLMPVHRDIMEEYHETYQVLSIEHTLMVHQMLGISDWFEYFVTMLEDFNINQNKVLIEITTTPTLDFCNELDVNQFFNTYMIRKIVFRHIHPYRDYDKISRILYKLNAVTGVIVGVQTEDDEQYNDVFWTCKGESLDRNKIIQHGNKFLQNS